MRVAIFGGSGKTGKPLIEQALAAGHEVIAIARTPGKITVEHPNLLKRTGDAFDPDSVIDALKGVDAVITTVGKTDLRDKRFNLSTAAHYGVVKGMQEHNIKRLLVISSIGAAQGIKRKGLRRNLYLFFRRHYYRDMFEMEKNVLASGLDVTIMRAPLLYNGPITGRYRILENENYFEKLQISRDDVAHFLIGEMQNNNWLNKVISIAD